MQCEATIDRYPVRRCLRDAKIVLRHDYKDGKGVAHTERKRVCKQHKGYLGALYRVTNETLDAPTQKQRTS